MKRPSLVLLLACGLVGAQGVGDKPGRKGGLKQPVQTSMCNDVPAHPFDLILGRPTAKSVTVSVLSYDDVEGLPAYGTEAGKLNTKTAKRQFKKEEAMETVLSLLEPNTQYDYQSRSARGDSAKFAFHTARPPGSPFTITITADSHLDEHSEPSIYQRTLASALAGKPDFHIDLGDTFMSEKHPDRKSAANQYLAQRFYFGQTCQSVTKWGFVAAASGKTERVHVEDDGDVLRQGGAGKHRLDVASQRPGARGAEDDLEPVLAVGANQRRRQHLAKREARREILGQTQAQGLQGELGTALMGRAGG